MVNRNTPTIKISKKNPAGKKHRKWGRNLKKCKCYFLEGRREKNKARKAAKYARHMAKAAQR